MVNNAYDEAIEKVLEHVNRNGFPTDDEGYENEGHDASDLLDALDTDGELKKTLAKVNARKYAAINIAVLRELRRRKGDEVYIAFSDERYWGKAPLDLSSPISAIIT